MYREEFLFGENHITAQTFFSEEKGYGFVDFTQSDGSTKSEQALYAGGWNIRQSEADTWYYNLLTTESGIQLQKERFVMVFKFHVPQDGSYRIKVESIAGKKGIENMMLFCGRRNLIERDIQLAPCQKYTKSFVTYVAPYIPAMTSIPCTEKAIYVSVSGKYASLSRIMVEQVQGPVLFIAGDSTLTDQNALTPYYPYGSCGGWAQMLAQYFPSLAICNQAHSGMTTNCFRDDGHWDILMNHLHEKDIVMLQFGHNDQKRRNLSAFGGYINNLRRYVKEIQQKGAYPIIASPISRIPFMDNGKYRSLLASYAMACQMAADECNVPYIDLHTLTFCQWTHLGEEKTKDYFMHGDITHTNDYGANLIASYVMSEIIRQDIEPLSKLLEFQEKKAFLPDCDTKVIPDEPSGTGMFDIAVPYVDISGIPQYDDIVKAFRKGLLDPCIMHLHPFAPMPRAQFLMIYFKALRISGKRPYCGAFCDISKYEWDASFVQTCIEENLIDSTTVTESGFRPDDDLTVAEFSSFVIRGMQKNAMNRNLSLELCFQTAKEKGMLPRECTPDDVICRADCYQGLVKLMDCMNNADLELPADVELHPVG